MAPTVQNKITYKDKIKRYLERCQSCQSDWQPTPGLHNKISA